MTERELRLFNSLRTTLESIQQDIRALHNYYERADQNKNVPPTWIDPLLAAHQQVEAAKLASDDRQYRVQNSLRLATWLAFVAAAVYAGIAAKQKSIMDQTYWEIQKQTKSAEIAANAAKESADLSFLTAENANAGVVTPTLQFASNEGSFSAVNRGHTIVKNVIVTLRIARKSWPAKVLMGDPLVFTEGPRTLMSEGSGVGSDWTQIQWRRSNIFKVNDWASIGKGEQFVTIDVAVSYDNGFRHPQNEKLSKCLIYLAPIGNQSVGPTLIPCDSEFDRIMEINLQSRKDTESQKGQPKDQPQ